MKKIGILLLVLIAAFALVACGNGDSNDVPEENPPVSQEPVGSASSNSESEPAGNDDPVPPEVDDPVVPFFFVYRDVEINLDQDVDEIITLLGEPLYDELTVSCAFEGEQDRMIAFPGIEIDAYPSRTGDNFLIFNIEFFDDTIRTAEGGIRLGNKIQSALDVYGEGYDYNSGMYRFTRGLTILELLVDENDEIISIAYRLDMSQFGV